MHIDIRFHFDEEKDGDDYVYRFVKSVEHLNAEGLSDDDLDDLHEIIAQSDYWHVEVSWKILEAMFSSSKGAKVEIISKY